MLESGVSNRCTQKLLGISPHWAWLLFLIGGCPGPEISTLPENIGQTHRHEESERQRPVREEVDPEPMPVGARVWADFRNTGFFFYGVVVERREEQHRVVYGDGSADWLDAEALLPDSLGLDTHVHLRAGLEASFVEGTISRRLGDAVYVRHGNGDERWNVLSHLRFAAEDEGTPQHGEQAVATAGGELEPGANVLVNYRQGGFQFGAVVTAVAEDGRLHVVYLDGETGWVAPQLVTVDTLGEGDLVHVRRQWEPAEWVRGRIRARHGHALQVLLDDGGLAWTAILRVRAPLVLGTGDAGEGDVTIEVEAPGS